MNPPNLAPTSPQNRSSTETCLARTWKDWFEPAAQHLQPVADLLPLDQAWQPGKADRFPAWTLYVQLKTRVATQPLRYRDGAESAAMQSIYELFVLARRLIDQHGLEAPHFAVPTYHVFERIVRPFTSFWHGEQQRGALARQDNRRLFRRELRRLSQKLTAFAGILADLAGATHLEAPKNASALPEVEQALWPDQLIGPLPKDPQKQLCFEKELNRIRLRRRHAYAESEPRLFGGLGPDAAGESSLGLVGLSLSGGGIRSATFCLGVVQCLARHGLFPDFDYISTVSGGGYLGSFLSARLGNPGAAPADALLCQPDGRTGDSPEIRHLRNHSKYLFGGRLTEALMLGGQYLGGLLRRVSPLARLYQERVASCYLQDYARTRLGELCADGSAAPYPLLNSTVNLPGSPSPELRGRRADFFVFTPDHVGSVMTGYAETPRLGEVEPELDLAAAMAISAAAVASYRGQATHWLETLAIGLLNLSLGRWLPNPGKIDHLSGRPPGRMAALWKEIRGRLSEEETFVHLSDGGHIENLGLYELLRRRCKLIVAVDGECDGRIDCGSLIQLMRFAAIDLDTRIEIDLSELVPDEKGLSQSHFSFGTIDYDTAHRGRERGYLVYIKSTMTGNEPAYVTEYRRRHSSFPHQSTANQLFGEDQFEAYRALGEHSAADLFGEDFTTAEKLARDKYKSRAWLEALITEILPRTRPTEAP